MRFTQLAVALMAVGLSVGQVAAAPFRIIVTSTEVPLVPNSVLHLALREGYFYPDQRSGHTARRYKPGER